MNIDTRQIYFPTRPQFRSALTSVGRFLWHFVPMVVAMEVGMMVYHHLLWPLLARTPYATLTDANPLIGYWGMLVSMVLGMLVLMRFQRSSWRACGEMTVAMIAPIAALTLLVLCSLIPSHILYAVGDPLMILAMAAYMLYRPHDHGHGGHEHTDSSEAEATKHIMRHNA